jgi:hypothetical protein
MDTPPRAVHRASRLANPLSIGEARISLDGQGLVGVSADNQDDSSADSNGTGNPLGRAATEGC